MILARASSARSTPISRACAPNCGAVQRNRTRSKPIAASATLFVRRPDVVKIRTAIFGVYVGASALGLAVLMAFVLHEVRIRYIEAMRRTLADTATLLAGALEHDMARTSTSDLASAWRASTNRAGEA